MKGKKQHESNHQEDGRVTLRGSTTFLSFFFRFFFRTIEVVSQGAVEVGQVQWQVEVAVAAQGKGLGQLLAARWVVPHRLDAGHRLKINIP